MPYWRRPLFCVCIIFIAYILQRNTESSEFKTVRSSNCSSQGKYEYYSYNGSCNNLHNPTWGQARTSYNRLAKANYRTVPGIECPIKNAPIKGDIHSLAEEVKNLLTKYEVFSHNYTPIYYAFGQWLNYDISHYMPRKIDAAVKNRVDCRTGKEVDTDAQNNCLRMNIPPEDELYSELNVTRIDFLRAESTSTMKQSPDDETCLPINFQSGFLDLSILYGLNSDPVRNSRELKNGKLKLNCSHDNKCSQNNYASISSTISDLRNCANHEGDCSKTDDSKSEPNPELMVMGALFRRIHNLFASQVFIRNDEKEFQTARRYLIAAYQHVIFNEYIPATIGKNATKDFDLLSFQERNDSEYMTDLNPQTSVEYSFAVSNVARGVDGKGKKSKNSRSKTTSSVKSYTHPECLNDTEFRYLFSTYMGIKDNTTYENSLRQKVEQIIGRMNSTSDIRYSRNLLVLDILRGVDVGLPTYNEARKSLNLKHFSNFEDLVEREIMSPEVVKVLKQFYRSVKDIHLYVGGLLEKHFDQDSRMGPTFSEIFKKTFYNLKFGDRLHYRFLSADFTKDELSEIRKVTFSYLMCATLLDNGMVVPQNAFLKPSDNNPTRECRDILKKGPNFRPFRNQSF